MTCLRNKVDLSKLLSDIQNRTAFKTEEYFNARSGNLQDYVKEDYKSLMSGLINIVSGGNGGMASIGRGEFFVSFMSNFSATISKSGNGDIDYNGKCEEMKFNGGKINVRQKQGREVTKTFTELLDNENIVIMGEKSYLPDRKSNPKFYSKKEIARLNALYWTATTGEIVEKLSYDEWKVKCVEEAAKELFKKSDSLMVIAQNNDFVRFTNVEEIVSYYKNLDVQFELRHNQSNPVSLRCSPQNTGELYVSYNKSSLMNFIKAA